MWNHSLWNEMLCDATRFVMWCDLKCTERVINTSGDNFWEELKMPWCHLYPFWNSTELPPSPPPPFHPMVTAFVILLFFFKDQCLYTSYEALIYHLFTFYCECRTVRKPTTWFGSRRDTVMFLFNFKMQSSDYFSVSTGRLVFRKICRFFVSASKVDQ